MNHTDESAEYAAWLQRVQDTLVPEMRRSGVVASVVPVRTDVDAKYAVELGLAIMLDKPLVMMVQPGAPIPPKLALVADKIIPVNWDDPGSRDRGLRDLNDAVKDLTERN